MKRNRLARKEMCDKRKRKAELLQPQLRLKQTRLSISPVKLQDKYVNECWARAFFALDIPINKINEPLFREAIEATTRSKTGYVRVRFVYFDEFL